MCYLPLGCLKAITSIGAIVSILISIALLGITIYANFYQKEILDNASDQFVKDSLVFLYIGSIIFLLLGICGLYGSLKTGKNKKGNPCLLGLFSIGIMVFFLLFLGATIFFYVGPKAIFGLDCKNGSQTSLIKDLWQKSQEVNTKFCKQSCPCFANDTTVLIPYLQDKGFLNATTDASKPARYQDCNKQSQDNKDKSILLLTALQQGLKCGGWCKDDAKFFRFTSINKCVSSDCLTTLQGCHQAFENFMYDKGSLFGFGCLISAIICFLNIVVICCICCHPQKKGGKKNNFYSKMLDIQH